MEGGRMWWIFDKKKCYIPRLVQRRHNSIKLARDIEYFLHMPGHAKRILSSPATQDGKDYSD